MAKIQEQEQKHQEYVNKINLIYGENIIVVGQFIDWSIPIEHYGIKHNNTFYASPNNLIGSELLPPKGRCILL